MPRRVYEFQPSPPFNNTRPKLTILLPSPLWGRGWPATGAFTSRGGTGEGVKNLCTLPSIRQAIGKRPRHPQHLVHEQLRRLENYTVGKSQHGVSHVLKMCVPARVLLGLAWLPVDTTVQFHDQAPLRTAKIGNVLTNRVLPAELEALQSEAPKQMPCGLFRFSLRLAEIARSVDL